MPSSVSCCRCSGVGAAANCTRSNPLRGALAAALVAGSEVGVVAMRSLRRRIGFSAASAVTVANAQTKNRLLIRRANTGYITVLTVTAVAENYKLEVRLEKSSREGRGGRKGGANLLVCRNDLQDVARRSRNYD